MTLFKSLEHTKENVFLAYITMSNICSPLKAWFDEVRSRSPTDRDEDKI